MPADSFAEYVAVNTLVDRPSLQELPRAADATASTYSYTAMENKYCPANMLPPTGLAENHQCYSKCYENAPCTDTEACFCDGFFPGHDTAESSALCLSQQQCEWLCSMTEGCHSIDMHREKNRCFLNTQVCKDHVDNSQLAPSADYDLRIKVLDENERRLQSKAHAHGRKLSAAQLRQLLAAQDPGISWESVLRFRDLEISSGGEFKLCFCDSALLAGENAICDGPEDFTIEVGRVHATGLQCLLSNPKMTRGTCAEQLYGGLRCYDDAAVADAAAFTLPTDYMGVPHPDVAQRSAIAQSVVAFCQFAPESEAMQFGFCGQYRIFVGGILGAGSSARP